MTTLETIDRFFEALARRSGWETFFADDVSFTSYTSPVKRLPGRTATLQAASRFYSMAERLELLELLVDGDRACARTRYHVRPPSGASPFDSDVAELFTVRDGQITEFAIYFDTAPYPR